MIKLVDDPIISIYKLLEELHIDKTDNVSPYSWDEEDILESSPILYVTQEQQRKLSELNINTNISKDIRIPLLFSDGTLRITRISEFKSEVEINGVKTSVISPIHAAHIVTGLSYLDPDSKKIVPKELINFIVILMPFKLINIDPYDMTDMVLGRKGFFEDKIVEGLKSGDGRIPVYFTDTSTKLSIQSNDELDIDLSDKKVIYGKLWRRHQDRAKVIMRIAEIILYKQLFFNKKYRDLLKILDERDSYVLMDGPPIQLSKYLRLVNNNLNEWFKEDSRKRYYQDVWQFLRYLGGATKIVRIYPEDLQDYLWSLRFSIGNTDRDFAWVYWMPHVSRGEEGKKITFSKLLVSIFYVLRPRLIEKFEGLSPFFGTTRLDLSIPMLLNSEQFKDYYVEKIKDVDEELEKENKDKDIVKENEEAVNLLRTVLNREEVKNRIISTLKGLRFLSYPIPPKSFKNPQRWATELFPIYITERWIKSLLLPKKYALHTIQIRC